MDTTVDNNVEDFLKGCKELDNSGFLDGLKKDASMKNKEDNSSPFNMENYKEICKETACWIEENYEKI